MIGCFPTPYQDELFYSVCARYAGRVQYHRKAAVVQELFGSKEGKGAIDLPTRLDFLVAALPPEHLYTADRFIDEHTLLPFYGPFLPPERLLKLREEMRGNNAAGIYFLLGLRKGPIRPARHLRYCPQCATEDRARWGETYWHRIPQLPGVLICPKHAIPFEETGVEALARRAAAPEFFAAERIIPNQRSIAALRDGPWHPLLLALARDAAWLLEQRNLTPGFQRIYQRYLTLLAENQFAPPKGKIRLRQLVERFQAYYPDKCLDMLQCALSPTHHHWLLGILHGDHIGQHPLHHLLLMQLLGSSAEEFFSLPVEKPPFGLGPWPCLNPASDHYRERVIEDCQITSYGNSHRLIMGTFTCACGFIYWRQGPDQGPEDHYHYEGITAYGPIWEEALRTLVERPDLDQQAIAKCLETSEATVGDQAARLGLKCSPSTAQPPLVDETAPPFPQEEHRAEEATREYYRAVWLAAMQDGQTTWAKDLREKEPKAYSWLYWHDREWLRNHMPPRKPNGPHLDWPTRDKHFAAQIHAAAERIKSRPGRPVRVTQNALSRELGQSTLRANFYAKQQLPLASQALDEELETPEACAVRKIWWAASCFIQEQIKPGRWDLLKRSGVRRQEASPAVQQAIDAALRTWSSLTEAKAG